MINVGNLDLLAKEKMPMSEEMSYLGFIFYEK